MINVDYFQKIIAAFMREIIFVKLKIIGALHIHFLGKINIEGH